jgi:uncharacterized membrane protein/glutaredoxin
MQNRNSVKVISLLVKQLGIAVTRTSIISELQKQDASSLLAISEALTYWNIPNEAYQVSVEELIETEIPLPLIACFAKGEFVLVSQKNENQITVSNDHWNRHSFNIEEFKNHYQGSILAFQKDDSSGERDYFAKRREEIIETLRVPFVVSGLIIVFITYLLLNQSYLQTLNWHIGFLTFFKTVGLIASILLLIQSVDANNPLIQKFCGGDNSKNCNAILSSKAAKLTEELSWSEIGFFYYSGTLISLLFNAENARLIQILGILNLLSLPYTFYSIFYQWRIAKQWCIFCCTVQALLWLEFAVFVPYLSSGVQYPDLHTMGNLFIGMLVPILLWVFVKPYLIDAMQLQMLQPELYRYKYNKELFKSMLHRQNEYALPTEENTIMMGNKEATNVITLVSNPFCIHCTKIHMLLENLLDSRDDIKLQLVFVNRVYQKEIDKNVIGHFMALKLENNEVKLKEAISNWYKQKTKRYELWKEKYPAMEIAIDPNVLSVQKEWCNMVEITSTPTLFINGRKLPSAYQAEDIKYVL